MITFLLNSDVGIHDRVVVQEMIKNVAQVNQLDTSSQKDFKGKVQIKYVMSFVTCDLILDCIFIQYCWMHINACKYIFQHLCMYL